MRIVDADALIKNLDDAIQDAKRKNEIEDYWEDDRSNLLYYLDNAPTIDAVEVVRGEWIPCTKSGLPLTEMMRREGQKWYGYRCSNCSHIYKGNALTESPFCQNCGAKMKGADDE